MNKNIKLLIENTFKDYYKHLNEKFASDVFSKFMNSCYKLKDCTLYFIFKHNDYFEFNDLLTITNGKINYVDNTSKVIFNMTDDIIYEQTIFNEESLKSKFNISSVEDIVNYVKNNSIGVIFVVKTPLIQDADKKYMNLKDVSPIAAIALADDKKEPNKILKFFGKKIEKKNFMDSLMQIAKQLEQKEETRKDNFFHNTGDILANKDRINYKGKKGEIFKKWCAKQIFDESVFNNYKNKYGADKTKLLEKVINKESQDKELLKSFITAFRITQKNYNKLFNDEKERNEELEELKPENYVKIFRTILWRILSDEINPEQNENRENDIYYAFTECVVYQFIQNDKCKEWLFNLYKTFNPNGHYLKEQQ